jgi:hypothetical protein
MSLPSRRLVTTERQARILYQRVARLRQAISELECDSSEWQCEAEVQQAFTKIKVQLNDAILVLSLWQPMKKH